MPPKSKIIKNYDIAYQDGWNMLEQVDLEELILLDLMMLWQLLMKPLVYFYSSITTTLSLL